MASTLPKTIVLITGGNSGLVANAQSGFETAKALFNRTEHYHILLGCRGDPSRASDAINKLLQHAPNSCSTAEPLSIDITSDDSISEAFERIKQQLGHIDILVNNAGADLDMATTSGQLTPREGWNETYNVNVTGTHLFTSAFAPLLLGSQTKPARLIFITSGLASVTEHAEGSSPRYQLPSAAVWPKPVTPFLPYRVSKTAMNMLATEWSRLLRNDGVLVFNISPGFLNTGLGDNRATGERRDKAIMGAIDPAIGANFCADVIEGKRDEQAWPARVLRKESVQPW